MRRWLERSRIMVASPVVGSLDDVDIMFMLVDNMNVTHNIIGLGGKTRVRRSAQKNIFSLYWGMRPDPDLEKSWKFNNVSDAFMKYKGPTTDLSLLTDFFFFFFFFNFFFLFLFFFLIINFYMLLFFLTNFK